MMSWGYLRNKVAKKYLKEKYVYTVGAVEHYDDPATYWKMEGGSVWLTYKEAEPYSHTIYLTSEDKEPAEGSVYLLKLQGTRETDLKETPGSFYELKRKAIIVKKVHKEVLS